MSPGLIQKAYGARDERAVTLGIAVNGAVLVAFAAVPTIIGMAAHARYPDIPRELAFATAAKEALHPAFGALALAAVFSAERAPRMRCSSCSRRQDRATCIVATSTRAPATRNLLRIARLDGDRRRDSRRRRADDASLDYRRPADVLRPARGHALRPHPWGTRTREAPAGRRGWHRSLECPCCSPFKRPPAAPGTGRSRRSCRGCSPAPRRSSCGLGIGESSAAR